VYAGLGLAVPVFGLATAAAMNVLGEGWLVTSITLAAARQRAFRPPSCCTDRTGSSAS
jgi:hypothetical protein